MAKIFEKYKFVAEYERVIECNDGTIIRTKLKIKTNGANFFPVWMHEIKGYSDCNSQDAEVHLVNYWEGHLLSAASSMDFTINSEY